MHAPDVPRDPRHPPSQGRRRFCAALLLAAAPGTWANPPAGTFTAEDLEWVDAARQRPVPVRLYRPQVASGSAVPLVVFSHGIGGSRAGYAYLGRHWASHGIASLHLQHVGSDRQMWAGNPLGLVGRLQGAAQDAEAVARAQDVHFALDRVQAGDAGLQVDTRRIAAAGHSYGANTTLLVSGAVVRRAGQPVDLRDPRVRAAVVISAPPFYGEDDLDGILRSVTVPSLHVTTVEDIIRIPGFRSGIEDRLRVFEATGGADKWLTVFGTGSHGLFSGRLGEGAPVLQATRELAHAFLRRVLDDDRDALDDWPRRHAELIERFVGPGPRRSARGQRVLTTA